MKRALGVGLALLALLVASAAPAARSHRADTLRLTAVFRTTWHGVDCPPGTPETTNCYLWTGQGVVPGLGPAQESYTHFVDDFGSTCGHLHGAGSISVTGKGEIDVALKLPGCAPTDHPPTRNTPLDFAIVRGSGAFAGASGSGTLRESARESGPGTGSSTDAWAGTLSVSGLTFDVTPPTISGAADRLVRTKRSRAAPVTYSVTASDDADGSVPVSCRPPSRSRFPIGRTAVNCTATDASGNTATARFFVTVKRIRR